KGPSMLRASSLFNGNQLGLVPAGLGRVAAVLAFDDDAEADVAWQPHRGARAVEGVALAHALAALQREATVGQSLAVLVDDVDVDEVVAVISPAGGEELGLVGVEDLV